MSRVALAAPHSGRRVFRLNQERPQGAGHVELPPEGSVRGYGKAIFGKPFDSPGQALFGGNGWLPPEQLFGLRDVRPATRRVVLREGLVDERGRGSGEPKDQICQVGDAQFRRVAEVYWSEHARRAWPPSL